MKKSLKPKSSIKVYVFVLLIAVELLMSFTFLGYIHIPPISITYAYLPIIIAGCFIGIRASVILGAIFGTVSLYKATSYYVMPADKLFSPFMSGYPIRSLILSVGTRVLFAFLIAVLFKVAKNHKYKRVSTGVIAFFASKLHASFVYLAMGTLFPSGGYGYKSIAKVGLSDVIVSLLCVLVIEFLWWFISIEKVQQMSEHINKSLENIKTGKYAYIGWTVFIVIMCFSAFTLSYYFTDRIQYMLGVHEVTVTSNIKYDLFHIHIQFVMAAFSLNLIMAVIVMLIYKYLSYKDYLDGLDALTKVMGRKMFLEVCEKIVSHGKEGNEHCFIFVDVDYFKGINDNLGHPVGDKVLQEIADKLRHKFKNYGEIGRLGGDEFAVIFNRNLSRQVLAKRLDDFEKDISTILPQPYKVSCSIGVYYFTVPQKLDDVYQSADKMLYEAKEKGRACYVMN